MACPNPASHGQLTSGDSEGANSCVAYSFSYGLCEATNGRLHASGEQIRDWTFDHKGGLELSQCDAAVTRHLGASVDTKIIQRAEFRRLLADERYGMVLIGGYPPIERSKFSGQPGFKGNHGIWVPSQRVKDPLCDGRRAGVYKWHNGLYPQSLIEDFAANLIMSNQKRAGSNHFEVSVFRMEKIVVPAPGPALEVVIGKGRVDWYDVKGGVIVDQTKNTFKHGLTARCVAPVRYAYPGHGTRRLIRLTSSYAKGRYVSAANPAVTVREV